jgi:hypothetical protein
VLGDSGQIRVIKANARRRIKLVSVCKFNLIKMGSIKFMLNSVGVRVSFIFLPPKVFTLSVVLENWSVFY